MMKRITKLMMATGAMMMSGIAGFAQRSIDMEVTMTSPAAGTILLPNVKHPVTISIKNKGTGNLIAGDTIYYRTTSMPATQIGGVILASTINSGTTTSLTVDTLVNNGTGTADVTVDFCVKVYDPNTANLSSASGPIRVSYNDPDTLNNKNCKSITIKKGTTGIFEFAGTAKEPLKLFPNPATDKVAFELNLVQSGKIVVSVKDITGREVMRKDFGRIQAGNNSEMSLDISRLRSGLYIVELNGEEKRAVGRFTKK